MKHYVIGLSSYLAALPLYAALGTTGFYVGLSATGTQWDFDTTNDVNLAFIPIPADSFRTPLHFGGSSDFDDTTWDYSIEARGGAYYRWGQNSNWLTAIEIFGGPHNNAEVNHFNPVFTFTVPTFPQPKTGNLAISQFIEARFSYGAELKQSYFFINNLAAFVVLGGVITGYDVTTNLTGDVNGVFSGDWVITQLTGWRAGGGFEKFWDNQLSVTLQVTYTGYETLDTSFENSLIKDINGNYDLLLGADTTFNPSAVQASVGLNYYFSL